VERVLRIGLVSLLAAGCASLAAPERREQVRELLVEPEVPLVVETRAALAYVTLADAFTFSSGFEAGRQLRARFDLPAPAPGFAVAFAAALRRERRDAPPAVVVRELSSSAQALALRGERPVLFAHTGEWRLFYDLSLHRYQMKVWLQMQAVPAAQVAAGRGAMALPERLWRGACTFIGPDPPRPIDDWLDDGALLRGTLEQAQQRCGCAVARRLLAFLERGEEQGVFDFGELDPSECATGDAPRALGPGRPQSDPVPW
jgi:hypothetical protein